MKEECLICKASLAKQLKVKLSQGIVVENALYGIKAVKFAKMFSVIITASLQRQYLKQADIVCKKLVSFLNNIKFIYLINSIMVYNIKIFKF